MKLLAFLAVPLFALGIGCNTAQVSQPANIDAGPPCPTKAPILTACASGTTATPSACAGGVTLALDYPDASATLEAGAYPLGCSVGFFVDDPASPDCIRAPACTCVAPDAGEDDGGDAGATVLPGVWSCFPSE
jgi:hypothetical protein